MTAPSHVEVLEELAKKWETSARLAHPSDAMLINKKVRELREVIAAIALMRAPVGDRAALEYLMVQFDAEFHACERCGHEEPTKDCDSAIYLRRYLGETK